MLNIIPIVAELADECKFHYSSVIFLTVPDKCPVKNIYIDKEYVSIPWLAGF